MKTNVPGLVKTERNAVVKRITIATSVDRVKPRLLLVDLRERHDLKDLRCLKVVVDAYYRYFVVLIRLGVYLRGRRVNDSVGDFEGRHRLADDTTVLGRREVYKKLSIFCEANTRGPLLGGIAGHFRDAENAIEFAPLRMRGHGEIIAYGK